eukprot:gene4949-5749_t
MDMFQGLRIGRYHRLFVDNYFSSIRDLFNKYQVYSTGTIRANRDGLSAQMAVYKPQEKGDSKYVTRKDENLYLSHLKYKDSKEVNILSTISQPSLTKVYHSARDISLQGPGIDIPSSLYFYRKHMGYVDRHDKAYDGIYLFSDFRLKLMESIAGNNTLRLNKHRSSTVEPLEHLVERKKHPKTS